MAGLTVDQLSASVDARLDNNSQNLLLWSGSFQTKLDELGIDGINAFSGAISTSLTNLSSSVSATSTSFNARINSSNSTQTTLSASVSDDVTNLNLIIDSLNDFSASITSSFNSLSASVSSTSASFSTRINTLRLDAGGVSTADFNALTQSLSGVISSSAQLNNATITNLTITNLTTINETASVVFSSGSNQFGDALNDTQILSGSVYIVGSGSLNGYTLLTSNNTSSFLTSLNGALSSSAQVLNGSGIFSSSAQLPSGLVSASSQVLVSSGIFSSSAQLPSGLVSASSQLPSGLVSASSQVLDGSGIFSSSAQLPAGLISSSINTGSFATTGSNQFTGSQNINGDVIITGSTLSVKKSTDSDPFFIVDADSKRLALVQGNGEIPGEFYLALSGSSAFSPRPEKTLLYGARGFKFQTNQGTVSEFTGSLTISSSAAVDLNVIGALNVSGSLMVSSSNDINVYGPKITITQLDSNFDTQFELKKSNIAEGGYYQFNMTNYGANGTWFTNGDKPIKILTDSVTTFAGNFGATGSVVVSGSLLMSGSIIPAVGTGTSTSSFSLGSATNAWKDLWVSNGTINFLGGDGTPQGTLSSTATGLQLGSSTISGSMLVTGSLTIVNALGNAQKVLSADGILGANYIAGNSAYNGVTSGFTSSIQPIISSYFNNYFSTVNSSPYKYQMGDLGIGTTYSYNNSTFTPAPAINVGYNPDLSFYTGSSSNIYSPGFSTIISSNNNLSGLERNETVAYSNGINHVLAVTGSLLSRDNTTLGTKATDLTYIRGAATISGSLVVTGSLTVSSSAAVDVNVIGKMNVTGSLEVSSSNTLTWYTPKLDIYNPDASDVCSFQLNKYSTSLGGYYNFTIRNNGDAGNGVWLTNGSQPLKIMTDDVITLGANNGATGSVKVIGSMTLAAQTVPTGTLAAGMMYFDSGTNQFLGYNGTTWVVLG